MSAPPKQTTGEKPKELKDPVPESLVKPIEGDPIGVEKTIRIPKWMRISLWSFGGLFGLILVLGLIAGAFTYFVILPPVRHLQQVGLEASQQARNLQSAAKQQNLTQMQTELNNLETSVNNAREVLDDLGWVKSVPRGNLYLQDADRMTMAALALIDAGQIGVDALVPYADLIGFSVDSDVDNPPDEGKLGQKLLEAIEGDSGKSVNAIIEATEDVTSEQEAILKENGLTIGRVEGVTAYVEGYVSNLEQLSKEEWVKYIYLGKMSPGEGSQTAEDRIQFVVSTLDKLVPELDSIAEQLDAASNILSQIDRNRYPKSVTIPGFLIGGEDKTFEVRSKLSQLIDLTAQADVLVSDARPVLEAAPYILGNDEPREYLVLFQNDAELRPTGGFLTAYALMTVDKGKITPGISKDIYDLDARYTSEVEAPQPLIDYIADPYAKEAVGGRKPRLRIRDSNLSPDFREAMDLFYGEYQRTGSPDVDGIIAVDTRFLVDLLEVTGPIGVGGIGNFSAETIEECNCPQVVYALESAISYETPYIRENRKAIIGPLMHSVLSNAMGTPKERMADLVQAGLDAIKQKHLMMYFVEPNVQEAIEAFNMGGRIRAADNDYLMIVDTNFAGAKSNLYIDQEVELKIEASDQSAIHELVITYKNPQEHDGWLNGDYRNWVRILLPEGSVLLEETGSETEMVTSEYLGKTMLEGFLVVRPKGLAKLELRYETPVSQRNPYNLLVQKQAGTPNFFYAVEVNGQVEEFELDGDRELSF